MAERATIIPVAGGKGGDGKTFVAANLAVALAKRGHSTITVDLDLGKLRNQEGIPEGRRNSETVL